MKLLLDTHAFIWAIARSRLLSARAATLISDPENDVLVSAVSAYEIEFKRRRDPVLTSLPADLNEFIRVADLAWLPLSPSHATTAGRLPRLAGDPFDRMLAAQALVEQATILTRDPILAEYGAVVVW